MKDFCLWCDSVVKAPENKNYVCCEECQLIEWLFQQWMSDEEINRRTHYAELTRGDDG
jgi:hypothetical protein